MDIEQNREIIRRKLRITDLQYCEMVERAGYEWIKGYFVLFPEMEKICGYSAMFWKWWVNQWDIRDNQFLALNRFKVWPIEIEQGAYNYTHDMDNIAVKPNRFVIEEVEKFIKNKEENI